MVEVMHAAKLVNTYFDQAIDVSQLVEIPFVSRLVKSEWMKFLLTKRVHVFSMLAVLAKMQDARFAVVQEKYSYAFYPEEGPEQRICIGPTVIDRAFSMHEMFEYLLKKLGVAHLDTSKGFEWYGQAHLTKQGPAEPLPENWQEECAQIMFVRLDDPVILGERGVYVRPEQKKFFADVLADIHPALDAFLDKFGDFVAVDHDVYVHWLMAWFPKFVRVRMLSTR